jgi:signal transduction histidine kinase
MGLPHMELPALRVQHITPYLLGQLWPQILFVLLLLGISASALIIAYRSLLKQVTLNSLRNDFIANISHELKTPVSTVKLALEALQKFDLKQDPKVSDEYLHMASRETDRLEGLVARVLQHQALEDEESLMNQEYCDLNLLMASAAKAMAIPIRENQASVELNESPTPCMVQADPLYLEGIIMNLLDNSLKYAGPKPRIQLIARCDDGLKRLVVKDHGPGIPEEFKNQVFDKFFRIPSGDRHNVKGYGLGLNFAAQVMAKLGGSISFRNPVEGGCEFVLEFPNT